METMFITAFTLDPKLIIFLGVEPLADAKLIMILNR